MVISLMVGCRRTWAKTGIVQTEKESVQLVMLMINYASVEHLGRRQRWSWICDTESNSTPLLRLSPRSCGMDKKHMMCDLVHEQNRKPYKQTTINGSELQQLLNLNHHVISQQPKLPQHPPACTARATTHPNADASRTGRMGTRATGVGGDGKARTGRTGDRDGNNGGAGEDGGRETEDHDAMVMCSTKPKSVKEEMIQERD